MPQGCSVLNCTGIGGHRFPRDKTLLQHWLVAIRRPSHKISVHSRVCKKHFNSDDYTVPKKPRKDVPSCLLKKYAVPSVFEWNEANCHKKNLKKRHAETTSNIRKKIIEKKPVSFEIVNVEQLISKEEPKDMVKEETKEENGPVHSNLNIDKLDNCPKVLAEKDEDVQYSSCGGQTLISMFCIENLRDDKYAAVVNFYTGFDNYSQFMCVFNLFGDDVNYLKHHPSMQTSSSKRVLTPCNEFYLILIKLKRNMCDLELSFNFQISESSVSNIFVTWINYLYSKFKDFHLWAPKHILNENLFFKIKRNPCIVVIDCTKKPENHVSSLATYNAANSLKMLLGISASGCVSYVSEAYDGKFNDGQLFNQCGIINVLQKCNAILGERGQDIVSHTKISSERIPVERVTELDKTFNILNSKFESDLVPLGNKILFVCFMLTNLRSA